MENGNYTVLYIEDQPEMIELVRLTLKRLGCDVQGVTDGQRGLQLMRELHPDLVLLDLMLPGCDGWQVSKIMQADADLRNTPLILVTARVSSHLFGERPLPHADAYVTKPFSLGEFRATVESILTRRVALAQAA